MRIAHYRQVRITKGGLDMLVNNRNSQWKEAVSMACSYHGAESLS